MFLCCIWTQKEIFILQLGLVCSNFRMLFDGAQLLGVVKLRRRMSGVRVGVLLFEGFEVLDVFGSERAGCAGFCY